MNSAPSRAAGTTAVKQIAAETNHDHEWMTRGEGKQRSIGRPQYHRYRVFVLGQSAPTNEITHEYRHQSDGQDCGRRHGIGFVKASGLNSRPSCASSANTGMKLTVMISSEKKIAGPTCCAACPTSRQRSAASTGGDCSKRRCTASSMTIAPSTIVPIAMAMPPSDMILALIPCKFMTMKAQRIPSGKVRMITSDERR